MELCVEKQAGEVNVACEAQPPRSEKNRAKASFGGVASGQSEQSDTTHEGLQEMASPAQAPEDALPFGEAPRFCTLRLACLPQRHPQIFEPDAWFASQTSRALEQPHQLQ